MMNYIAAAFFLFVNIWAFAVMGIDKAKAKKGKWRISEKALFLPVILGGGIGGMGGMYFFRHKTRHWYFRYGYPFIFIMEFLILLYIYSCE